MEKKASWSATFFLCCFTVFPEIYYARRIEASPTKLFVFGDSYADTGNTPNTCVSWTEPYGITFPGKPSGRFSDGRVLTDFIAGYLGIRSPVPYRRWRLGSNLQENGMNFAYGGTGVFTTLDGGPNMTTQINDFHQLIEQHVYTKGDLISSFAHVSVAGNDYTTFKLSDDPQKNIDVYTESVIRQLVLNLKRIHDLGVGRVSVVAAPPFGCLPIDLAVNASSSKICYESDNFVSRLHNQLLKKAVEELNNETGAPTFVILDLYSAFMSALNIQNDSPGNSRFENPLEECCRGTRSRYSCGDVEEDGTKGYVVCENSKMSFFWDSVHPSQQGWFAVFSTLRPSLHTLLLPHAPLDSSSAAI